MRNICIPAQPGSWEAAHGFPGGSAHMKGEMQAWERLEAQQTGPNWGREDLGMSSWEYGTNPSFGCSRNESWVLQEEETTLLLFQQLEEAARWFPEAFTLKKIQKKFFKKIQTQS